VQPVAELQDVADPSAERLIIRPGRGGEPLGSTG
jgi:hypothetical protein